jgi:sec-independent protein translocase protein TatA
MVGDILQPTHLLFILVVALLVLGPKRLPEVGRTLGSGLRDFRQAINGEATSHQEHEPHGYVEPEPDPVPPHADGADGTEPTDVNVAADDPTSELATPDGTPSNESAIPEVPASESADPATPTALHDLEPTALHDLAPPVATDDLEPAAANDEAAAIDHGDDTGTTTQPVAAVSSTGFASALAASRQQPVDGDEPPAGDE